MCRQKRRLLQDAPHSSPGPTLVGAPPWPSPSAFLPARHIDLCAGLAENRSSRPHPLPVPSWWTWSILRGAKPHVKGHFRNPQAIPRLSSSSPDSATFSTTRPTVHPQVGPDPGRIRADPRAFARALLSESLSRLSPYRKVFLASVELLPRLRRRWSARPGTGVRVVPAAAVPVPQHPSPPRRRAARGVHRPRGGGFYFALPGVVDGGAFLGDGLFA